MLFGFCMQLFLKPRQLMFKQRLFYGCLPVTALTRDIFCLGNGNLSLEL